MNWRRELGMVLLLAIVTGASAQALYKYTDKDGKVTYSDRAPKPGEKAESVNLDGAANIVPGERKTGAGDLKDGKAALPPGQKEKTLAEQRAFTRETLAEQVENARKAVEDAKKALEAGRDASADEQRIVVGKTSNTVQRQPAYYERIEKLEAAVKAAEEKLEKTEESYRRGAPD
jgi:hypothetical protein